MSAVADTTGRRRRGVADKLDGIPQVGLLTGGVAVGAEIEEDRHLVVGIARVERRRPCHLVIEIKGQRLPGVGGSRNGLGFHRSGRIRGILQLQANRNTLIGRIHPHGDHAAGRGQRINNLALVRLQQSSARHGDAHRGTRPRRCPQGLGRADHGVTRVQRIHAEQAHRGNRVTKVFKHIHARRIIEVRTLRTAGGAITTGARRRSIAVDANIVVVEGPVIGIIGGVTDGAVVKNKGQAEYARGGTPGIVESQHFPA